MMPVVTNFWKVKIENCPVWRSETARRFSPNPGTIRAKARLEGRVEATKNVSAVDALVTSEPETSQNVPLGTINLGSCEVLSNNVDVDDFSEDALEEVSKTLQWRPPRRRGDRRGEESPFFDCWDCKHEQSDVLQQVDPLVRNAPKPVPSVKGCLSVNFPVCSVCQKLGVYQHLPTEAPQYDISSEGEGRLDEVPFEVARVTTPMIESGGPRRWT